MQILSLKQIIVFKIVLTHTEGMQQFKLDQPLPPFFFLFWLNEVFCSFNRWITSLRCFPQCVTCSIHQYLSSTSWDAGKKNIKE